MALRRVTLCTVLAAVLILPLSPAAAHQWSHDRWWHDRSWDRDRHWDREDAKPAPAPEPTLAPGPTPAPAPAPAPAPGGSGGPRTDRLGVPFTAAGHTSSYHLYASGLDWDRPVGLLMYGDGSGGYGLDNPSSPYLLAGPNGLAAVAAKHNLILVVPQAPGPGCDGYDNCWYDAGNAPAKAAWSSALMTQVKAQYPVDNTRIAIGGYSSGAQWATRWFLPAHGQAQSVDLAVAIAYGGAPAVPASFTPAYKASTVVSFDTGTADAAYTTASWGARGGHSWYTAAGFTTDAAWPAGVGHSRSGAFGSILDRELTQHLPS